MWDKRGEKENMSSDFQCYGGKNMLYNINDIDIDKGDANIYSA